MTLLYFAQSLFLVFASVYIAKESIETVLLGEGAHSHGGGGGHGHGSEREHGHDHDGEVDERYIQLLASLLGLADYQVAAVTTACTFCYHIFVFGDCSSQSLEACRM